ncbi:hypothetical protein MTR67_018073 [Solanum verrucosum]|uniref:Uncharacterized protein n=1 Tax=Solanum verrucosum TaxID=315347 RepID=A0AAF0QKB3_SOLVR|nr:hypothetical protein MTR67_018073 [Solanum verrucosum]
MPPLQGGTRNQQTPFHALQSNDTSLGLCSLPLLESTGSCLNILQTCLAVGSEEEEAKAKKDGGGQSQPASGGPFGRRGTRGSLKEKNPLF